MAGVVWSPPSAARQSLLWLVEASVKEPAAKSPIKQFPGTALCSSTWWAEGRQKKKDRNQAFASTGKRINVFIAVRYRERRH
jgi:hypothetical protein